MSRNLTLDVGTLAGLTAAVYACPARLRPALGLAAAVGLSRLHRAGIERATAELTATLTDQRAQITPRVAGLEERYYRETRLIDDLDARVGTLGELAGRALERLDDLEDLAAWVDDHFAFDATSTIQRVPAGQARKRVLERIAARTGPPSNARLSP